MRRSTFLFQGISLPGILLLAGCYSALRLEEIGDLPPLTRTQDPTAHEHYHPVQMPMPEERHERYKPNSLWRTGARTFFKDQRASRVGDIVTVILKVDNKAEIGNDSHAERTSQNDASFTDLLGAKKLPKLQTKTTPKTTGKTHTKRSEMMNCAIAATIVQILPNGNLVISGRQEMRIDFEVRDVFLTGVIRPEDINSVNTIPLEKIAEARISYGGRGQHSDLHQVPLGQQLLNKVMPF